MKTSPTVQENLVVELLKIGQYLQLSLDHFFQDHGLSRQQYNVLRILRGAEKHSLNVIELRDRLIETQSDITRLLKRLLDKKFISRRQDVLDKRKFHIQLEIQGLTLCNRLDEHVLNWNKTTFSCFETLQIEQLTDLASSFNHFHSKEEDQ